MDAVLANLTVVQKILVNKKERMLRGALLTLVTIFLNLLAMSIPHKYNLKTVSRKLV